MMYHQTLRTENGFHIRMDAPFWKLSTLDGGPIPSGTAIVTAVAKSLGSCISIT